MQSALADEARFRVEETITTFIQPIIRHLAAHAVENYGRLDAGDQWAVRVLKSRERFLWRLWAVLYAEEPIMTHAKEEMKFNLDDGRLLMIGEKQHRAGTYTCMACESDVVETDDGPMFISKMRVCPRCERGFQHAACIPPPVPAIVFNNAHREPSADLRWESSAPMKISGNVFDGDPTFSLEVPGSVPSQGVETPDNVVATSPQGDKKVVTVQYLPVFWCDNPACGHIQQR